MKEKHYYHISTKGLDVDLFKDEEDFRQILFIIALTFGTDPECEIVCYSILNNHIHLVVYGVLENIDRQLVSLKKRYSMWYAKKYGIRKIFWGVPCKIRKCVDHEDVKCCILISHDNNHTPRAQRKIIHSHCSLPKGVRLLENGAPDPLSLIKPEHVRDLMRSAKSLNYFIFKSRDGQVNANDTVYLCNDMSAREKAKEIASRICGRDANLENLSTELRMEVANVLKYTYGTPSKVVARILGVK